MDSENLILPALRAAVREIKAERHSAHAAGKVVGAVGMHAALLIIRKHLGKWLEEGE